MKHLRNILVLAFSIAISACALHRGTYNSNTTPNKGVVFGESSILGNEKLETVETEVLDVCAKKGCWVKLAPPESLKHLGYVLARFKNKEFSAPVDLKGKQVKVSGRFVRRRYSPASQKEFLNESGAKEAASQVQNQIVERMEIEVSTMEVL